jgi:hypothetical protein
VEAGKIMKKTNLLIIILGIVALIVLSIYAWGPDPHTIPRRVAVRLPNGWQLQVDQMVEEVLQVHVSQGFCPEEHVNSLKYQECKAAIYSDISNAIQVADKEGQLGVRIAMVDLDRLIDFPGDFSRRKFPAIKIGSIALSESTVEDLLDKRAFFSETLLVPEEVTFEEALSFLELDGDKLIISFVQMLVLALIILVLRMKFPFRKSSSYQTPVTTTPVSGTQVDAGEVDPDAAADWKAQQDRSRREGKKYSRRNIIKSRRKWVAGLRQAEESDARFRERIGRDPVDPEREEYLKDNPVEDENSYDPTKSLEEHYKLDNIIVTDEMIQADKDRMSHFKP